MKLYGLRKDNLKDIEIVKKKRFYSFHLKTVINV